MRCRLQTLNGLNSTLRHEMNPKPSAERYREMPVNLDIVKRGQSQKFRRDTVKIDVKDNDGHFN